MEGALYWRRVFDDFSHDEFMTRLSWTLSRYQAADRREIRCPCHEYVPSEDRFRRKEAV